MSYLVLLIVLSAVTYRVGRFIILDTLIQGTRAKVVNFLDKRAHRLVFRKLGDLLECPYCVTIWVAAGAVGVTWILMPIPVPVWTWLAVATGALVFWSIVDRE